MNIAGYFRKPFPSQQGFSAYRSPGMAAHLPFLVALSAAGLLLCGSTPALRPFVLVWMLAGLFIGRDVAILCHYAPFLVLLIWAAMYTVIAESQRLTAFGRKHPAAGVLLTAFVLMLQIRIAWRRTTEKG